MDYASSDRLTDFESLAAGIHHDKHGIRPVPESPADRKGNTQSGLPPGMGGPPDGEQDKDKQGKDVSFPPPDRTALSNPSSAEAETQMGATPTGPNWQEETTRPECCKQTPHRHTDSSL